MPSIRYPITYKSETDLEKMKEGGRKLAKIKNELKQATKNGINASEIEDLATKLIEKEGGKPSFKMVPGYKWSTCININSGLVHGIPKKTVIFKNNDLVSIDLGLFYKGFHTDTSFTKIIGQNKFLETFLNIGEKAMNLAINSSLSGNRIYDISRSIENVLNKANLKPIKNLVGHGIGRNLHEEPEIPCFINQSREKTPKILPGMTLAIEVMYTQGCGEIVISDDGWTISTADGKISALFEETIAITKEGPNILTA